MTDKKHNAGFTLIELMVVIGIISLLSSVVMSSLAAAKIRAQDLTRVQNLVTLRNALELYYADNQEYPKSSNPVFVPYDNNGSSTPIVRANFLTQCDSSTAYVPNLVPKYIAILPLEKVLACNHSFQYISNGTDYKLITHPVRDSFPDFREFPGSAWNGHYGVWTPPAANWWGPNW